MSSQPFPSMPSLPAALEPIVQPVYCIHNADHNRPSEPAELIQITGGFKSGLVQNAFEG